jgi:hypothetical protein
MRGDLVFRFALGVFWIRAFGLSAQDFDQNHDVLRLQKNRQTLIGLLNKVENGRDPCFSDQCQQQKLNLLGQIYQNAENIPGVDRIVLQSRQAGIQSAYDLIRKRFSFRASEDSMPRTAKEWWAYWKKRSNLENELQSSWMGFLSEIYSVSDGLQIYSKTLRRSSEDRALIQEAWDRGAAEASELMIRAALLSEQASALQSAGNAPAANDLRKQALQLSEKREQIESRFKGQFRGVLESLFPNTSFKGVISFFSLIKSWAPRDLFEASFSHRLTARADDVKSLSRLAQEFTDLEYGVVGIRNFSSKTNPAIAAEAEVPIQEFLDQVESRVHTLIELGASYLLLRVGRLYFDSPLWANFALPTTYNLLSIEKSWSLSTTLVKPSTRLSLLQQSLPTFEEQMEKRYAELLKTRELIRTKISEIDTQLLTIKQAEGTHD